MSRAFVEVRENDALWHEGKTTGVPERWSPRRLRTRRTTPTSPRTALCTIATGTHRDLFEVARPGFERFAAAHGYELVVVHNDDISAGRAPSWGKVRLLRRLLDTHDRVVWVDSDAVIVDPSGDIFAGVDRRRPLSLVVHHYDGMEIPNAGVLTLRSGRWSKRLLDRLWAAERFIDHKWWENAAIIELLGYDVDEPRRSTRRASAGSRRVGELDLSWNSVPVDPSPNPRIVHFAGMTQAERLTGMSAAVMALHEHQRTKSAGSASR